MMMMDAFAVLSASGLVSREAALEAHMGWLDPPLGDGWATVAGAALGVLDAHGAVAMDQLVPIPELGLVPLGSVGLPDGTFGLRVVDVVRMLGLEPYLAGAPAGRVTVDMSA